MSKFILLGRNKIFNITDNLETAMNIYLDKIFEYIEIGYHITLKTISLNNLIEYFNDFIIQEFIEGSTCIKTIKFDFQNYIFINDKNVKISEQPFKISILMNKLNIHKTSENIDIFIPLDDGNIKTVENTINTEFINKLENENKVNDIEFIKKRIDELTHIRDSEYLKINDIKTNIIKKKEEINKDRILAKSKKSKLKYEKEKWEELKRNFDINLNIYKSIKSEMVEGIRQNNDIPELFNNEYIIFLELDNNLLLDNDNIFNLYLEFKKNTKNNDITNFNNLFESQNLIITDDENSSDNYFIENSDQDCIITEH
jgi:hypothetical protein